MLIKKFDRELYASHFQFYLEDENSECDTGQIWDMQGVAHRRMLALCDDLIAVGTGRYETVPVSLELHTVAPLLELEKYSRVNECSLRVKSERLILSGCLEDRETALRIEIETGIYRVRVLYGNLESVVSEDEGDDFYILQMWRDDSYKDIEILKAEQPFFWKV